MLAPGVALLVANSNNSKMGGTSSSSNSGGGSNLLPSFGESTPIPSHMSKRKKTSENRFSVINLLTFIVIGSGLTLVTLNIYHASTCPVNNPDAVEAYINAIGERLKESESQVAQQALTLNSLVKRMQSQLAPLDPRDIISIKDRAKEKAISIGLAIGGFPAPPIPWELESQYKKYPNEPDSIKWDDDILLSEADDDKENGADIIEDDFYDPRGDIESSLSKKKSKSKSSERFGGNFHDTHADDDGMRGFTDGQKKKGNLDALLEEEAEEGEYDDYVEPKDDDQNDVDAKFEGGDGNFKDGLSDEAARGICSDWKAKFKVKIGQDWGELPFDLQVKWLAYSCDHLLQNLD